MKIDASTNVVNDFGNTRTSFNGSLLSHYTRNSPNTSPVNNNTKVIGGSIFKPMLSGLPVWPPLGQLPVE